MKTEKHRPIAFRAGMLGVYVTAFLRFGTNAVSSFTMVAGTRSVWTAEKARHVVKAFGDV